MSELPVEVDKTYYAARKERERRIVAAKTIEWKYNWSSVYSSTNRRCTCGRDHNLLLTTNAKGESVEICPTIYFMRWHIIARERRDVDKPTPEIYQRLIGG